MMFKKNKLKEAAEDGTLFSSENLTIKREGGVLKFDFSMPGWWHDSEDPSEAISIIAGSKYKTEQKIQQIQLTDTDKSNINISEFIYWLSGGNRQWSPGGNNDFNVDWETIEPVAVKKFGAKYLQELKGCSTLGDMLEFYLGEKEEFVQDFWVLASEQGWIDYEEESPQENNRIKTMKRTNLAESKKRVLVGKLKTKLKKLVSEEYASLMREAGPNDFHQMDNLLRGFTFEELITTLQSNEREINPQVVTRVFNELVKDCLEEARHELKTRMKEIIKNAQ